MSAQFDREDALNILTHAPAEAVKKFAEQLILQLGEITVLKNRTGLVMLPYTDSAQGTKFHLGEVLVAEAHICLAEGTEGYGMILGRDVTLAMGVAVIDAAFAAQIEREKLQSFLTTQQQLQVDADEELLRKVEATRVEMETF